MEFNNLELKYNLIKKEYLKKKKVYNELIKLHGGENKNVSITFNDINFEKIFYFKIEYDTDSDNKFDYQNIVKSEFDSPDINIFNVYNIKLLFKDKNQFLDNLENIVTFKIKDIYIIKIYNNDDKIIFTKKYDYNLNFYDNLKNNLNEEISKVVIEPYNMLFILDNQNGKTTLNILPYDFNCNIEYRKYLKNIDNYYINYIDNKVRIKNDLINLIDKKKIDNLNNIKFNEENYSENKYYDLILTNDPNLNSDNYEFLFFFKNFFFNNKINLINVTSVNIENPNYDSLIPLDELIPLKKNIKKIKINNNFYITNLPNSLYDESNFNNVNYDIIYQILINYNKENSNNIYNNNILNKTIKFFILKKK